MKAMILAAGLGSRLRPLTTLLPKPLFPLLNIPLLDYTLELLRQNGMEEVLINLHHLPDLIPSRYGDGTQWGMQIIYSREAALLGSAGALRKVARFWKEEPLLVLHGDVLLEIDLSAYIRFHQEQKALATLALIPYHKKHGYGIIKTDEEGRIQQFLTTTGNTDASLRCGTFSGIQILEPSIQPFIPPQGFSVLTHNVYPELVRQALPFLGYYTAGDWSDIGTPERYLKTHCALLAGRFPSLSSLFPSALALSPLALGKRMPAEDSREKSQTIFPPVLLGQNVQVGKGVTLGPFVVVGNDCQIGDYASLSRSVLWDSVVVEAGVVLEESIVGSGVRIAAREILSRTVRVASA